MCFFFQAEDGIRDIGVTGVQTCALPICDADEAAATGLPLAVGARRDDGEERPAQAGEGTGDDHGGVLHRVDVPAPRLEIGRASCRERVEISVVAVSLNKKIACLLKNTQY